MIRKLTRKKKKIRYDANAAAVMPIYERATQRGSADYLTINQESDPATLAKIFDQATARRQRRGLIHDPEHRVKRLSTIAGRYYDPAKGGAFTDSRGRKYRNWGGTVYRVKEA